MSADDSGHAPGSAARDLPDTPATPKRSLSSLFIYRPVATSLLTIGIALAGALSFALLPVSPLPDVDFPTISVQAALPGASPETMAATVATPLERALGRIPGITEITSTSTQGNTRVVLQFDLDRAIDGAARDVQAAINAARTTLPSGLPSNPTYRKVNPADAPVLILALTSQVYDRAQMYDAASTVLAQTISQVQGVGQVEVGGAALPAVRVALIPQALNQLGIGAEEVRALLGQANANRPKGAIDDGQRRWQIGASDQAQAAAEFAPMIIRWQSGSAVRLSDVATVRDSMQDVRNAGYANGKPAIVILVRRQPGANVLDTVDRVRALLPALQASIPGAMNLEEVLDATRTTKASLHDVERTLLISVVLVILVVFVFLRSVRATLIPAVAVPVSLLGAFVVMKLAGMSLNNLSLMALTVAAGFVVDDAVVVLENITRHLEAGKRPLDAALLGAREVGFTVVSMSVSLIAVFIPVAFMGGIVGRFMAEFAVTLSVAILVSLLVSLTTTPMMCAKLLRTPSAAPQPSPRRRGWSHAVSNWLGQWAENCLRGYDRSLRWALHHPGLIGTVLLATVVLNVWLYVIVPKGFLPQQDSGRLIGRISADESASFEAVRSKLLTFMRIVQADPDVDKVVGFTGGGQRNTGFMFVSLKPKPQRQASADQVVARLRKQTASEPGAGLFLQAAQDLRVGGRSSNAQYQFTLQGDDLTALRTWEPRIRLALSRLTELADVSTDEQARSPQVTLNIDRTAAARLGVDVRTLNNTLNDLFGQRQVSTIYRPLNQYRVVLEAQPEYTAGPESLNSVYISSANGAQIPLSALATWSHTLAPSAVNHQGQFAASTISFNLSDGVSLSQAQDAILSTVAALNAPRSIQGSFQGTAKAFQASTANQPWLLLVALLTIYIVLGVLYESLLHPITILSTLPSAGLGALLALMAVGTEFSLIAFIGVILLVGIVKKNAILMIDFALDAQRRLGLDARQAIHRAAVLRLRPILMTTVAAMLGAVPLAIGSGEGAETRQPLGIAIVGGLLVSQVLTLYTTPVVYLGMERLRHAVLSRFKRISANATPRLSAPAPSLPTSP